MTNSNWTEKSDFAAQVDPIDDINSAYEATFGGRIVHDRLWFFGAGRYTKSDLSKQTTLTNVPYVFSTEDKRFEAKLTGQITPRHSVIGSFIDSKDQRENNVSGGRVVDLQSLAPFNRPRTLLALNYNGLFTDRLLLEGQLTRMNDKFTNGAETRDLINGTLLVDDDAAEQPRLARQRLLLPQHEVRGQSQSQQRRRGIPAAAQRKQFPIRKRLPHSRQLHLRQRSGILHGHARQRPDRMGSGAGTLADLRLRHAVALRQRPLGPEPALQLQSRRTL
jgi:hypothetical protein